MCSPENNAATKIAMLQARSMWHQPHGAQIGEILANH